MLLAVPPLLAILRRAGAERRHPAAAARRADLAARAGARRLRAALHARRRPCRSQHGRHRRLDRAGGGGDRGLGLLRPAVRPPHGAGDRAGHGRRHPRHLRSRRGRRRLRPARRRAADPAGVGLLGLVFARRPALAGAVVAAAHQLHHDGAGHRGVRGRSISPRPWPAAPTCRRRRRRACSMSASSPG